MSPQDEFDLHRLVLAEYRLRQRTAAACQGKAGFASRSVADQVAARMRKNHDGDRIGEPARCEYCGQWHIHSKAIRRSHHGKNG